MRLMRVKLRLKWPFRTHKPNSKVKSNHLKLSYHLRWNTFYFTKSRLFKLDFINFFSYFSLIKWGRGRLKNVDAHFTP